MKCNLIKISTILFILEFKLIILNNLKFKPHTNKMILKYFYVIILLIKIIIILWFLKNII